jgi:hypothetical protein
VKEIEGKEHESVRRRVDGGAERIEVGDAVLVLEDDLTVDQGSLTAQLAASIDRPAIGGLSSLCRGGRRLSLCPGR